MAPKSDQLTFNTYVIWEPADAAGEKVKFLKKIAPPQWSLGK